MATVKDDRIYVRVSSETKEDFEAVAEYRGLKSSTLLHSLIVKTVHEARRDSPEIFDKPKLKKKTLDEVKKNK